MRRARRAAAAKRGADTEAAPSAKRIRKASAVTADADEDAEKPGAPKKRRLRKASADPEEAVADALRKLRDTLGADPSGFTADAAEKLLTDLRDLKDNFRADDLQEEFLKRNGFDDVLKGLQEVFNVGQKELEGLGAEDAKRKM